MRKVEFPARDRLVLALFELVQVALPTIAVAAVLWVFTGPAGPA